MPARDAAAPAAEAVTAAGAAAQQQQQQQQQQEPDYDDASGPHRFLQLARAFGPSRAFQVAVQAGVFEALHAHKQTTGAGATWRELAAAVGFRGGSGEDGGDGAAASFRGVVDLLDLLVVERCLARAGAGPGARYALTPEAERYLVAASPDYVGGLVVINAERTYPQFLFLEDSLRTGAQPPAARGLVRDILSTFGGAADPDATLRFAVGMSGANRAAFAALAGKFDWARYKTLRDIGGSAATLACTVAAAHPHLRAASADLPALRRAAEAAVRAARLEARVAVEELDFFGDGDAPFAAADVITMSMILHDWGVEKKLLLMRKVRLVAVVVGGGGGGHPPPVVLRFAGAVLL